MTTACAFGLLQSTINIGGHWYRSVPMVTNANPAIEVYDTDRYQWSTMVADGHQWPPLVTNVRLGSRREISERMQSLTRCTGTYWTSCSAVKWSTFTTAVSRERGTTIIVLRWPVTLGSTARLTARCWARSGCKKIMIKRHGKYQMRTPKCKSRIIGMNFKFVDFIDV